MRSWPSDHHSKPSIRSLQISCATAKNIRTAQVGLKHISPVTATGVCSSVCVYTVFVCIQCLCVYVWAPLPSWTRSNSVNCCGTTLKTSYRKTSLRYTNWKVYFLVLTRNPCLALPARTRALANHRTLLRLFCDIHRSSISHQFRSTDS